MNLAIQTQEKQKHPALEDEPRDKCRQRRWGLYCVSLAAATVIAGCADDGGAEAGDSRVTRNRAVVTRLIEEGLNNRNSAIALELAAEDFVDGDAFPDQPEGPEGLQFHFDVINRSIPDLVVEFTLVAEGNTVVEEWTGRGNLAVDFETGQPLASTVPIVQNGITVFELNDEGLITERRTFQRGEQ